MVEAAKRAEGEGIDAVFAYDHYPRAGRPEALHGLTMLGALAVATSACCSARSSLRVGVVPDAVRICQVRTAARLGRGSVRRRHRRGRPASPIPKTRRSASRRPPLDERFVRLEDDRGGA